MFILITISVFYYIARGIKLQVFHSFTVEGDKINVYCNLEIMNETIFDLKFKDVNYDPKQDYIVCEDIFLDKIDQPFEPLDIEKEKMTKALIIFNLTKVRSGPESSEDLDATISFYFGKFFINCGGKLEVTGK